MFFKSEVAMHTRLPDSLVSLIQEYSTYPQIQFCFSFYSLYQASNVETRDPAFTKLLENHLKSIVPTYERANAMGRSNTYGEIRGVSVNNMDEKLKIKFHITIRGGLECYEIAMDSTNGKFTKTVSIMSSGINGNLRNVQFISFNNESINDWSGKDDGTISYEAAIEKALKEDGLLTFLSHILSASGKHFKLEDVPAVTATINPQVVQPTVAQIVESLSRVTRRLSLNFNQLTVQQRLEIFSSCHSIYIAESLKRPALLDEMNYVAQQQFMAAKVDDNYCRFYTEDNGDIACLGFNSSGAMIKIKMSEKSVMLLWDSSSIRQNLTFKAGLITRSPANYAAYLEQSLIGQNNDSSITSIFLKSILETFGDQLVTAAGIQPLNTSANSSQSTTSEECNNPASFHF